MMQYLKWMATAWRRRQQRGAWFAHVMIWMLLASVISMLLAGIAALHSEGSRRGRIQHNEPATRPYPGFPPGGGR